MAVGKIIDAARERLKHALWAGAIALVLMAGSVLLPIDQLVWAFQSRIADRPVSGEIAFVYSDSDIADEAFPERRVELANSLQALREAGVARVFVDTTFDKPSTNSSDAALNRELRAWGDRLMLVDKFEGVVGRREVIERSSPAVSNDVPTISLRRTPTFSGYTWEMAANVDPGGQIEPNLPTEMADSPGLSKPYKIFYGFDLEGVPNYSLDEVQAAGNSIAERLSDKTVIIGTRNARAESWFRVPKYFEVPGSVINIFAAETLKAGLTFELGNKWVFGLTFAGILVIAFVTNRRRRSLAYAFVVIGLILSTFVAADLGIYTSISASLAMLFFYAAFRARSRWQKSVRLVDDLTGLPTFNALDGDQSVATTGPAIIVARIHRFEEVRKTLPPEYHAEYVTRIVDRLRAARPDEKIYAGPGHLIAWTMNEKDPVQIRDHLDGLRALFSAPLQVGNAKVDVGITFGVDVGSGPNVARRLANAVSAAESTNETYDPVNVAEDHRDEDLMWNISLQSRIDTALENGEIYLIYQPKVLVKTGEMVGVESLVRWRDPERGLIPPDDFIRQCENAGRMSHLTRHVLREACLAGNEFSELGMQVPVAVNVSATLLHEYTIVDMVREVLEETGFEPRYLTLEVTETYRISNLQRAQEILDALRALGAKVAMDDFGVGAASLEALMKLPFDELKIDRLFTSAITADAKAAGIVRHILKLGRDLNIVVVAEGVENESTFAMLEEEGCLVAQGYAISRPISFAELVASPWFRPELRAGNMV